MKNQVFTNDLINSHEDVAYAQILIVTVESIKSRRKIGSL